MAPRKRTESYARHRLHQLLHHVGWSLSLLEEPRVEKSGLWQLAPLPDGQTILFLFLNEPLPALDAAFRAYEDFSPEHRRLFSTLREQGVHARHALLIDEEFKTELVDLAQEDVLLHVRNETELNERMLPLLTATALARGSLTAYPRKTPRQRARELDEWTRLWTSRLGAATGASREQALMFFEWLHLSRLAEQLGIGKKGLEPITRFGELPRNPPNAARRLLQSWKPLAEQWCLLQGTPLKNMDQLARRALDNNLLLDCLSSYGRLSRGKFSSDIFAEAFGDEELRLVGWRHSLVEALPQASDAPDPARWLSSTFDVDLDATGFPGLLAAYNQVAEELRMLARQQAIQRQRGERPGVQLDLLGTEPPPLAEEEAPRLTLQNVLRVTTTKRFRAEIARMVLLAHTAEWFARLHRPESIFPVPQVEVVPGTDRAATPPAPPTSTAHLN
ncbi:hypothetical protein GC173_10910 [bacterium]|nr:hypothetical protein [bacterium]